MPLIVRVGNEGRATRVGSGDVRRVYTADNPDLSVGAGRLLWEWNGVDTSQFEAAPAYIGAGWTAELVLVGDANSFHGSILRLNATAVGGVTDAVYWLVRAPLPVRADRRRLVIEANYRSIQQYGGQCFAADAVGAFHAMSVLDGVAAWTSRVDAGVLVQNGNTVGVSVVPTGAEHTWVRRIVHVRLLAAGGLRGFVASQSARFPEGDNNSNMWRLSDPALPGFPASWNGLEADRWGLVIQKSGGAGAPRLELSALRVLAYD